MDQKTIFGDLMVLDRDEKFLLTHLEVLKLLLNKLQFTDIMEKLSKDFEEINYIQRAKQINFITMDDKNNLIAAYPVSPFKTKFKVEIENIGTGYAMCAIDALGIAYTFMQMTKIISKTADRNPENVFITIDPIVDSIETNKEFFVSYKDPDLVQNIALDQCPMINFYSNKDSINDPNLMVFDFNQAIIHSKTIFSLEAFRRNIKSEFKAIEK